MAGEQGDLIERKWRDAVQSCLAELPNTYAEAGPVAARLRSIFLTELGEALEPRLNTHLNGLPHDTYEEKKTLSTWLNHELHYVQGLSIRCPRTGNSSVLTADIRDAESPNGRFRLESHEPNGRTIKTLTSTQLPEFQLMPDPPRIESFSRWRKGPAGDKSR